MKIINLFGRIFFSLIFLNSGFFHFAPQTIAYARSMGVPMPALLVPLSGIIAIAGALSIMLGYKARLGAWLLVIFLLPVTFMMHAFWQIADPMMQQVQMSMFMKNIAMLGGALIIAARGAGGFSFDERSAKSNSRQ